MFCPPSCVVEKKTDSGPIFGSPAAGTPVRRGGALVRRPATAGPPGATLKPISACFMTRGCTVELQRTEEYTKADYSLRAKSQTTSVLASPTFGNKEEIRADKPESLYTGSRRLLNQDLDAGYCTSASSDTGTSSIQPATTRPTSSMTTFARQ